MKSYLTKKPNLRIYLIALITFLFAIPSHAQEAYQVRWAMIGNSITQGVGLTDPATERYSALLDQMLSTTYGDTNTILNAGVSGRTMMKNTASPIWNEAVFASAIKLVPDICLIFLGTNDSKPLLWASIGDQFPGDFQAMIDTFRFRNPYTKFIVCLPPPIFPGHPYSASDPHNDSILVNFTIPILDSIGKANGAIIVDFHTPLEDSIQLFPDKLHPNAQGHKIMADILMEMVNDSDLIHQVDPGLAFVSNFEQSVKPVAVGKSVDLRWTTIFADSVFLNGELVDASGSKTVVADTQAVYNLTAKGSQNTSVFPLILNAYVPEKDTITISVSSYDYGNGNPVTLFSKYYDQYNKAMEINTSNIIWTVIQGEGQLSDQTDTSILFTPTAVGSVIIKANDGDVSGQKTLNVNKIPTSVRNIKTNEINVYPNPVNNRLFFRLDNSISKDVHIRIYNVLGDKLLEQNFVLTDPKSSTIEFNLSGINQGVYVYAVSFGNEVKYGRFLKQESLQ